MHAIESLLSGMAPALLADTRPAQILDALPAALYTTDADGRITYFNQAAADLWGQRPVLGEAYWCGSYRLYHPDGTPLPHDECPMARALKSGQPVRGVEAIAERPDGTRVAFVPHPTPLFDSAGALVGGLNMLIDISARKETEAALRAQSERFDALNNIAKALSSDLELERIVQEVTDSATKLAGAQFGAFFYNLTDSKGESYVLYTISGVPRSAFEKFPLPRNTDVFDPTFRGVGIVRSDDIRRDPRYGKNDPHFGMPEGHLPVVSYLAVPVVARSGEVHGGLFFGHERPGVFTQQSEDIVAGIAAHAAIALDNAHLLRAAQHTAELRERAEKASMHLAAIVESSDDAIVSKDLNGTIVSWNKGAQRLFGYTSEEITGKSVLTLIPQALHHEEPGILARIRSGNRIEHFETVRRRKDGTLFDISLTISPVRDSTGRIVGASKIARDITERKRAAQQRDLLIAELNHRVKNTLATVVAISHQSFTKGRSPQDAHRSFENRIRTLAQTHSRLAESNWSGVSLEMLVRDETAPYRDERGNVRIAGPNTQLNPKSTVSLGMAFHELTTNAAKYGALSTKDGYLEVTWSVTTDGELRIRWQESGGPAVPTPERSGFGRLLLERALKSDLDADVRLDFVPAGLLCVITFPLDRAAPSHDSPSLTATQ